MLFEPRAALNMLNIKCYCSFQFDRLESGFGGRHSELDAEEPQLPSVPEPHHGRLLWPHPHRLHHRGLGHRDQVHQGHIHRPGTQVLNLRTLQNKDGLGLAPCHLIVIIKSIFMMI